MIELSYVIYFNLLWNKWIIFIAKFLINICVIIILFQLEKMIFIIFLDRLCLNILGNVIFEI